MLYEVYWWRDQQIFVLWFMRPNSEIAFHIILGTAKEVGQLMGGN